MTASFFSTVRPEFFWKNAKKGRFWPIFGTWSGLGVELGPDFVPNRVPQPIRSILSRSGPPDDQKIFFDRLGRKKNRWVRVFFAFFGRFYPQKKRENFFLPNPFWTGSNRFLTHKFIFLHTIRAFQRPVWPVFRPFWPGRSGRAGPKRPKTAQKSRPSDFAPRVVSSRNGVNN